MRTLVAAILIATAVPVVAPARPAHWRLAKHAPPVEIIPMSEFLPPADLPPNVSRFVACRIGYWFTFSQPPKMCPVLDAAARAVNSPQEQAWMRGRLRGTEPCVSAVISAWNAYRPYPGAIDRRTAESTCSNADKHLYEILLQHR